MSHKIAAALLTFLVFWSFSLLSLPKAQANVLFEGWFEVYKGSKKIGFVVERYDFADGKFKATYYLKTNADGNNVTESVKAFAKSDLSPLSYAYTTKVGDSVKIIDAKFKGETENLEIFDGKKKTKTTKKIKKGTFLSQFLMYLILQQPGGLSVGKDYSYYAIAEEDGDTYKGDAFIKSKEPVKGKDAFKILNEFKGEKFFSWATDKGEPLLTRSPENNIEVRFADSREEATKGMLVKLNDIQLLFGTVPGEKGGLSAKPEDDSNMKAGGDKKLPVKSNSAPKGTSPTDSQPGSQSDSNSLPNPGQGVEIKGVKPPPSSSDAATPEKVYKNVDGNDVKTPVEKMPQQPPPGN